MSKLNILLGAALMLYPALAKAEKPVVVELYTSQGCAACPPADRLLAELATHDYIIALALHVDYWDYLGWADVFADPAFSDRQRLYAREWGKRTVYTPQMVVQGVNYMVGSRSDEIKRQIMQAEENETTVSLSAQNSEQGIRIELAPLGAGGREADIQLVRYSPGESVTIERGENAGKTIEYVNIVESWENIGHWDGIGPMVMMVPEVQAGEYVVIIQAPGPGEIYAAARVSR